MLLRRLGQDKPEWQVLGADREPMLVEKSVSPWRFWAVGSASDALLAEVARRLQGGEDPSQFIAPIRETHEGHYALLFLDDRRDRLVAAADPYAIVKLYVASAPGEIAVGTCLPELLAVCRPGELLPQSLAYFFVTGYTPARQTFWRNVEKVSPGTVLDLDRGQKKESSYLGLLQSPEPLAADDYLLWFEQHWSRLFEKWLNRFQRHVVAVSGGIDSTFMLSALLRSGMPREQSVILTTQYRATQPCPDNACDLEYAGRVASHYGIRHEIVPYDLQDERLVDDFRRAVRAQGSDSSFSLSFRKSFDLSRDTNACIYCGQNADSVLSFGTLGHPSLALEPPFLKGLGGWCQRFYMFGGLHERRWRPERPIVRRLLDRYLHGRYGVGLRQLRPEDFLLGIGVDPSNWPFIPSHESFAHLADPNALAAWFWEAYVEQVFPDPFAANPHAVFLWLYLQTYMQGGANRATTWGGLDNGSHVFLPFTNLGLLRHTARLRADGRFYWHGKFPNVFAARRDPGFPRFVFHRKDGPESYPIFLSSIFCNQHMNAYARHLLASFDPARFQGILQPRYLARDYWGQQLAHYEAGNYAAMDLKLFPRVVWLLALEEQARQAAEVSMGSAGQSGGARP